MPHDSQTNIRLPKKLKEEARIKALKEGKSFSTVIRELLEEWLKSPVKPELEKGRKKEPRRSQKTE